MANTLKLRAHVRRAGSHHAAYVQVGTLCRIAELHEYRHCVNRKLLDASVYLP